MTLPLQRLLLIQLLGGGTDVSVVGESEITEYQEKLNQLTLKPITGTMKIHQLVSPMEGVILYRDLSCVCQKGKECKDHQLQNKTYIEESISKVAEFKCEQKRKTYSKKQKRGKTASCMSKTKEDRQDEPEIKIKKISKENCSTEEKSAQNKNIFDMYLQELKNVKPLIN